MLVYITHKIINCYSSWSMLIFLCSFELVHSSYVDYVCFIIYSINLIGFLLQVYYFNLGFNINLVDVYNLVNFMLLFTCFKVC